MTRLNSNATFNRKLSPIVLPHKCVFPFNACNTTFHKDAFWSLLLPVTPNNRTYDVWRGYWAQRLMWDIGGHLLFHRGPTYQRRSNITLQGNPLDDMELHARASDLVKFLMQWSDDSAVFHTRVVPLSQAFADQGFWGNADIALAKAWVEVNPFYLSLSFPSCLPSYQHSNAEFICLVKEQIPYSRPRPAEHLTVSRWLAVCYPVSAAVVGVVSMHCWTYLRGWGSSAMSAQTK
jgi:hypothetical protein